MKKIVQLVAIAAVSLSLVNCSDSVEDRVKAWEHAKTRATTLKASYPGFSGVLDKKNAEAKAAWDAAQKETDKEKKIEALGAASLKLSKLTSRMAEVESKIRMIRDDLKNLGNLKLAGTKFDLRKATLNNASVALSNVNAAMMGAAPATMPDAMVLLDSQVSSLITLQSNIRSTLKSVKPKTVKKKKSKKSKKK